MHALKSDIKKLERLKKRSDFVLLNQKGRKWVSQGLVIQALAHDENDSSPAHKSRIGFTVTKRTDKSAVTRNRIKRRMRAAAAEVMGKHAKPGYDYNLIGRPATETRPYAQLVKDIKWCLRKMDLYHEHE